MTPRGRRKTPSLKLRCKKDFLFKSACKHAFRMIQITAVAAATAVIWMGVLKCPSPRVPAALADFLFKSACKHACADLNRKSPTGYPEGDERLRSRADSNCCTRFCRPLPSHSATRPIGAKVVNFQSSHTRRL